MGQNTSFINIHLMFHLLPVMESYTLLVILSCFPFFIFFFLLVDQLVESI
jgi:hypothetical protein